MTYRQTKIEEKRWRGKKGGDELKGNMVKYWFRFIKAFIPIGANFSSQDHNQI